MPDWIVVIILGIVEGITEFIPVSSTGHLLIAEKLLHVAKSDLFNVVIQCGAVIAVLPLAVWQSGIPLGRDATDDVRGSMNAQSSQRLCGHG